MTINYDSNGKVVSLFMIFECPFGLLRVGFLKDCYVLDFWMLLGNKSKIWGATHSPNRLQRLVYVVSGFPPRVASFSLPVHFALVFSFSPLVLVEQPKKTKFECHYLSVIALLRTFCLTKTLLFGDQYSYWFVLVWYLHNLCIQNHNVLRVEW